MFDSGDGRKKETGPRCSGRLIFIRPRASRIEPPNVWRSAARELGLANDLHAATARGYLVQGESLDRADIERLASELLADSVVERTW